MPFGRLSAHRPGRATKKAGKVVVWDYFNSAVFDVRSSLAGGAPCWRLVKDTLMREWLRVGDPAVCGRVPELVTGLGFAVEDITPLAPIVRAGSAEWIWCVPRPRCHAATLPRCHAATLPRYHAASHEPCRQAY